MPKIFYIKKYADDILNYIIGHHIPAELPQKIVDAVYLMYIKTKCVKTSKYAKLILKWPTDTVPLIINQTPLETVDKFKYFLKMF